MSEIAAGPRGFGLYSIRVRQSADSFELPAREPMVFMVLFMILCSGLVPFWRWGVLPIIALCTGCGLLGFTARNAVVVTRERAWCERRLLGIRWWRHDLGQRPDFMTGHCDWSELAVCPTEILLRRGLHDNERFVLLTGFGSDEATERYLDHLATSARDAIRRLHSGDPTKGVYRGDGGVAGPV